MAFSNQLAGILNGEGNFQVLVPVGADRQFSFPDPFRVILNDTGNFEIVFNVEFFQSGPDCKEFVPSLGVEPDLTAQILHRLCLESNDFFPVFIVC